MRKLSASACAACSRSRRRNGPPWAAPPVAPSRRTGAGRGLPNGSWSHSVPATSLFEVGEEQKVGYEELLAASRAGFEEVPDFTLAVEEEFALLDPATLGLVNRFEDLQQAAKGTELEPHLVGELIASEVEVRTGRCDTFAEAADALGERRAQLRALADGLGVGLSSVATHPWSPWQEQRII